MKKQNSIGSLIRNLQAARSGKDGAMDSVGRALTVPGLDNLKVRSATQTQVVMSYIYDGQTLTSAMIPTFHGLQVVTFSDKNTDKRTIDKLFKEAFTL